MMYDLYRDVYKINNTNLKDNQHNENLHNGNNEYTCQCVENSLSNIIKNNYPVNTYSIPLYLIYHMNITQIMEKNRRQKNKEMYANFLQFEFDIKSMNETLFMLKKKLGVLKEFDKDASNYYKLWIVDQNLYIHRGYFQSVRRWYYSQGREVLYEFIKREFNNYSLFIQMVELGLKSPLYKSSVERVHQDNKDFLQSIVNGIEYMKQMYPDYNDYQEKVGAFKCQVDKYLARYKNTKLP